MTSLTRFETEVLDKVLFGPGKTLEMLRFQAKHASVQRELSGGGFFIDFDVDAKVEPLPNRPTFTITDVIAEIEGLRFGAMFVMFVTDGKLSLLEGSSSEEPWPKEITNYRLNYTSGENRDFRVLQESGIVL